MAVVSAVEKKLAELGQEQTPEEFVEALPPPVRRRVAALKTLQEKHEELETEFRKERAALEAKYEKLYAPLYTDREAIVTGAKAVPKAEGEEEGGEDKGVPDFWLGVLLKCDATAELVKDKDVDVLTYLRDITSESMVGDDGLPRGFKLRFFFNENPYFTNSVLEKTYEMSVEEDGVVGLDKPIGTTIDWKPGKDVTIKVMKKKPKKGGKPDAKPQIKTEKVDSFFNFFSPPDMPAEDAEMEEEEMEELQMLLESDYDVGATIRERLVPDALRWYTGEAVEDEPLEFGGDYDEDDEDDEDEDGDDDDDEDDEDDDDDSPKPKGGKKKGGKAAVAPGGDNPECKQQ